jgi:hypothetical protein
MRAKSRRNLKKENGNEEQTYLVLFQLPDSNRPVTCLLQQFNIDLYFDIYHNTNHDHFYFSANYNHPHHDRHLIYDHSRNYHRRQLVE